MVSFICPNYLKTASLDTLAYTEVLVSFLDFDKHICQSTVGYLTNQIKKISSNNTFLLILYITHRLSYTVACHVKRKKNNIKKNSASCFRFLFG